MCNSRNSKWIKIGKRRFRVDGCIRDLIRSLNEHGIQTLASCCGHAKYPITIIYRHKSNNALNGNIYDFCSGWGVQRKRKFYKKDKQGYYFIPEVSKLKEKKKRKYLDDEVGRPMGQEEYRNEDQAGARHISTRTGWL